MKRSSAQQEDTGGEEMEDKILEVKNLVKYFDVGRSDILKAVNDVSFHIFKGKRMGWLANPAAENLPSAARF